MKKLLKNMSKVLSIFLLLCSTETQSSEFSKQLTNQFIAALVCWHPEAALRMLNDPVIVSQIDVNARDKRGDTPFMKACDRGHQKVVEKLLELKKPDGSLFVDVNARNSYGDIALMYACNRGRQEIVKKLLELKNQDGSLFVDVNARNHLGHTALLFACWRGFQGIVEKLLELKKPDGTLLVDVNAKSLSNATSSSAMLNVFKKESIKPLLYFLAEKKYQRDAADYLVSRIPASFMDDSQVDCRETVEMVQSANRLSIKDGFLRKRMRE